jgi:hypothetical protein
MRTTVVGDALAYPGSIPVADHRAAPPERARDPIDRRVAGAAPARARRTSRPAA